MFALGDTSLLALCRYGNAAQPLVALVRYHFALCRAWCVTAARPARLSSHARCCARLAANMDVRRSHGCAAAAQACRLNPRVLSLSWHARCMKHAHQLECLAAWPAHLDSS